MTNKENTRQALQPPDVDKPKFDPDLMPHRLLAFLWAECGEHFKRVRIGNSDHTMSLEWVIKQIADALTRSAADGEVDIESLKYPKGFNSPEARGYNKAIDDMRQRGLLGQGLDSERIKELEEENEEYERLLKKYMALIQAAQPQGDETP